MGTRPRLIGRCAPGVHRLRRRAGIAILAGVVIAVQAGACGGEGGAAPVLTLATTTTIEDSGLLPVLIEGFREIEPGIRVRTVTGGTREVLEIGRRGDVDLVLSYDPAAEEAFVAEGYGTERREVMANDFVVAGPPTDPAGVRGLSDAVEAFKRIAASGAPFVSRADESGTHRKELRLWGEAGIDPVEAWGSRRDGYIEAGIGMGDALRLASERRAYILTDRATYLWHREILDLELLVEGDPRLLNVYGIIPIAASPHAGEAEAFVRWITGPEGQALIGRYGTDRFGRSLFIPSASSSSVEVVTP
jgi:tungstate transport system substrate-binding protein